MSKQKSSQAQRQRFSGPELTDLLEQVVTELGPSATITEVNKVRSGGVAGFFCREEFEVLVDTGHPGAGSRAGSARTASPAATSAASYDTGQGQGQTSVTDATPDDINDARFRAALLRRINHTAETEATMAARQRARVRTPDKDGQTIELTDGPIDLVTPPSSKGPDSSSANVSIRQPKARPNPGSEPEPAPLIQAEPAPLVQPEPTAPPEPEPEPIGQAEPEPELEPEPVRDEVEQVVEIQSPGPDLHFWSRLASVQEGLHAFVPNRVGLTAVVGPLACAMPVVRRLQCQDHLDPDDVVVLTNRAEIVSEPAWKLVRQDRQLVEAAVQCDDRSRLLVIDVPAELPNWVAPLIGRLRVAGIDLIRYVVPGNPAPDDLLGYWAGPDDPYVIDLVSRLSPESAAKLIKHGHPIATIAGVEMSAALLIAMGGADGGQ